MGGSEGFACQVCYSLTELVVTRRDDAALFTVEGVTDLELGLAAITMCWDLNSLIIITNLQRDITGYGTTCINEKFMANIFPWPSRKVTA